jgi:hypothetical protein
MGKTIFIAYLLSFYRNPISIVLKAMFDLYRYHIPVREETLLVIIYPAVFGQFIMLTIFQFKENLVIFEILSVIINILLI